MPRHPREPITEPYLPLLAEAAMAYRMDAGIACRMASKAVLIRHKQEVWSVRSELRAASATAVAECANQPTFSCESSSVCGTGACRYAAGDLTQLDVEYRPGKELRPQPHVNGPTYNVESCVKPLLALRTHVAKQSDIREAVDGAGMAQAE